MTSSHFVSSIRSSIIYALVVGTVTLVGCESTGPYPEGSLAAIKQEHRSKMYRDCVMNVFRENPFNPYIDHNLVIDQCSRFARKRIPK